MVRGTSMWTPHENSLSTAVREDASRAILARIDNGLCRARSNWDGLVCQKTFSWENWKIATRRGWSQSLWVPLATSPMLFSYNYVFSLNIAAQMRHHHHISLREQLQVAGAANNPIMQSNVPTANVTTPGSDSRKSIFNRLGIRKPSILSLSSPQFPSSNSTARTFSLDDLLRPPPRRKHFIAQFSLAISFCPSPQLIPHDLFLHYPLYILPYNVIRRNLLPILALSTLSDFLYLCVLFLHHSLDVT